MRREDLKQLLIEVGVDILNDEGLARGTERLTFKRVFDRAGQDRGVRVTNASVIGRIWSDMSDYQADVLAAALEDVDQARFEETIQAAADVVAGADLATPDGRTAATREVVRMACGAHLASLTRSRTANLTMGLRGLAVSRLPLDEGTPAAAGVRHAYETYSVRWDYAIGQAFEALGVRMRPGVTVRQLSMLAISLAEGCSIWERVDPPRSGGILLPTGPEGTSREWTLFALGLDALVERLTELDPDWPPGNPE